MPASTAGGAHSFSRKAFDSNSLRRFWRRSGREIAVKKRSRADTLVRWCKFNLVGAVGIFVQFAVLFLLKSVLHIHYLAATALAVEAAVLHNFFWHERFTWADRTDRMWPPRSRALPCTAGAKALSRLRSPIAALKRCATQSLRGSSLTRHLRGAKSERLLRFHLANGAVSVAGNLGLMRVVVGLGHMNYLVANLIAIALCSVGNFLVSDGWVFGD